MEPAVEQQPLALDSVGEAEPSALVHLDLRCAGVLAVVLRDLAEVEGQVRGARVKAATPLYDEAGRAGFLPREEPCALQDQGARQQVV